MRAMFVCLFIAAASGTVGSVLHAAPPALTKKPSTAELAVDLVELRPAGPTIRGAVLNRAVDGTLTLAVSRSWLQTHAPAIYEQQSQQEQATWKQIVETARTRLDRWATERVDEKKLQVFLKQERNRLTELADGEARPPESQFLLLSLPASRVKNVSLQIPARRQIALAAWHEELADVETRSAVELERALRQDGVDPAALQVDLTDRLPAQKESEAQWTVRQAIVEYDLRKPLDFQGSGDVLIRTGEGAKPPAFAELTGDLLKSQLGKDLGDLFGDAPKKPAAPSNEKATKAAEAEGLRGVRITRVDQNLAARRATVTTEFVARLPNGNWQTVWQWVETADASKPRPEAEARISKDPQIKQALGVLSGLGLGGEADDTVKTAIRFGAAVMEAQQNADARFFRFRDTYTRKLEGPPLPWTDTPGK